MKPSTASPRRPAAVSAVGAGFVLLIALLASGPASAGVPADLVKEIELANGMKFLFVERHQSPTVAAFIAFRVGSADEPRGATGMAHFLEHMQFKGTARLGTADWAAEKETILAIERTMDAFDAERQRLLTAHPRGVLGDADPLSSPELDRLTAEAERLEAEMRRHVIKNEIWGTYDRHGGSIKNAFTGRDMTGYYVVLPANQLEVWAMIEAERLTGSVLREFYSERSVVQEERRRSRESTPGGMLSEALASTAFTIHPYGNPVIGWMSDLEHLRRDQVLEFYRTFYQPSNAVGILVGDFAPAAAEALVREHFGRIDSRPVERPRRTTEPPLRGRRERLVEFDAEPQLRLAYRVPALQHPDFPALDVLVTVLGDGRTSRLRKRLILTEQAARSARADLELGIDPGLLEIALEPLAGRSLAEVEAMAREEMERLAREPASPDELAAVSKRMQASLVYQFESNISFARWLAQNECMAGGWRVGYEYVDRIAAVTADDVMRVAADYLTPENEIRVELRRPEEGTP